MDERLTKHLQEQLARERNERTSLLDEIEALRRELTKHDSRDSAVGVADEKRKLAEERKHAAERNAEATERKLRDAQNENLRLDERAERLSGELELARAESDKLQALHAKVEGAKNLDDLIAA